MTWAFFFFFFFSFMNFTAYLGRKGPHSSCLQLRMNLVTYICVYFIALDGEWLLIRSLNRSCVWAQFTWIRLLQLERPSSLFFAQTIDTCKVGIFEWLENCKISYLLFILYGFHMWSGNIGISIWIAKSSVGLGKPVVIFARWWQLPQVKRVKRPLLRCRSKGSWFRAILGCS